MSLDRVGRHRRQRFGRNPTPPERLAEPVSNLGRDPFHVLLKDKSNAANRLIIDGHREDGFGMPADHGSQEFEGIPSRVRKWEPIAQVEPDFSVVSVSDQSLCVGELPRSNGTLDKAICMILKCEVRARPVNPAIVSARSGWVVQRDPRLAVIGPVRDGPYPDDLLPQTVAVHLDHDEVVRVLRHVRTGFIKCSRRTRCAAPEARYAPTSGSPRYA